MNTIKKIFEPVDMTTGAPWEKIALFTVPMLIGNFAQQMYNTVDSIVVGQYVGDNALAAVGSAAPILNLLIVLFVGISVGAGIVVSQYYGAKERDNLSGAIGNCIMLTAIASLIIMVVASLIARPLLELLHTPESIIDWCASYLQILFLGAAGLGFYNILSGVLRGLGDSVSALLYLLVSTGINMVLDILFVTQFEMGINGVALATAIAQGISAVLCIRKLMHMNDIFDMKWKYLKPEKKHAMNIIRLGVPSGLSQAVFSVASIVVQSLINSFGEQFIAANVIVMRVDGFAMLPNLSFSNAFTIFAGQNVGAKLMHRVEEGTKQGTFLAMATTGVITALLLLFARPLMGIFTSTEELVTLSMKFMMILSTGYVMMAVTQSLSGAMRGAGDVITPMWIAFVSLIVIRIPLAYGLVYLTKSDAYPQGRPECIFISLLIAWFISAILQIIFYRRGKWKTKGIK